MVEHAADRRAAALAAKQHGLITRGQALACGLTPKQVRCRQDAGAWVRIVRGVYRVAGVPDAWRQRALAAQMAVAGAGGVVSHATAAALHGVHPPSPLPHVTVPPTASARTRIAKVHRARVDPLDQATLEGIRCTSASRALVDLAGVLDRPGLEAAVDLALTRGLASPGSVQEALGRVGDHRRGRVLLRSVLEVWSSAIEPGSPAEVRLIRTINGWGLPPPVTQHEVFTDDAGFVARIDVAWPRSLVAVEYEGRDFHAARRIGPDEVRYARLRALGWRIATATKLDLLPGETHLRDLLRAWLRSAAA